MTNFIPISYLNEACFLSLNTDDKKYAMCLKMAQADLSDTLGVPFYDELETQLSTTPSSLSADNDTLYEDYIRDYLAWQTYYNYLKFVNVDATPTGMRQFNDENSSIASELQMHSLERHVKSEATRYKNRMINFLKAAQGTDSTKYPLFTSCCCGEFAFGITSISGNSDTSFRIERSVSGNE